ncbi:hypothetical protein FALBO_10843 [Fusarium albosuccineum]|uniref:Uncharacterized protein n=1 Tax=Fusarium albosuccineum TaxID=1237068 RepID=A0A8H4L3E5_9HYPO|nr:hypothetical protein FALBO_10843 [Fusarium albosuccineum]
MGPSHRIADAGRDGRKLGGGQSHVMDAAPESGFKGSLIKTNKTKKESGLVLLSETCCPESQRGREQCVSPCTGHRLAKNAQKPGMPAAWRVLGLADPDPGALLAVNPTLGTISVPTAGWGLFMRRLPPSL